MLMALSFFSPPIPLAYASSQISPVLADTAPVALHCSEVSPDFKVLNMSAVDSPLLTSVEAGITAPTVLSRKAQQSANSMDRAQVPIFFFFLSSCGLWDWFFSTFFLRRVK